MDRDKSAGKLKASSLGIADIVFFVVAAAAPLGATLGAGPAVFSMGGNAAPGLYLIASFILLLFAVGFAAMSRYVVSAGGFAELIGRGLGKRAGNAAAGIALLAYVCMLIGIYAQFAAFGADTIKSFTGLALDWRLLAFVAVAMTGVFGYMDINLSAKVLGVLMILEVLILVLFDGAVLVKTGGHVNALQVFSVSTFKSSGMGTALMFAFSCFVGFESTTIYGEEARNPQRTIPWATYIAIGLIGVFYTLTMWCLALAYAGQDVQHEASANPITFVFTANTRFVGEWSTQAMQVLVITSLFAVLLSFHNALCRYFFALARARFLPASLSKIHEHHGSPHVASVTLTVSCAVVLAAFMFAKADPVQVIYMWMVALGTLGVLVLQTLGAAGVVAYFARAGRRELWQGFIAPILGGAGLLGVVIIAVTNFDALSGATDGLSTRLPWLVLIAALAGIVNGSIKRSGEDPSEEILSQSQSN
ncbi:MULTISPECIES: APC family permease [Paraburkholderia]|uniref:APC family permease n=1 Tax=Paraburkholderia TaxID=1822464 RepID=UPI002AB6155E|nr:MULTISPECIES: APC family permease [Paraburkholderia]